MPPVRARDLGIVIGEGRPGRWNAITDVAGVRVGHHGVTAHRLPHDRLVEVIARAGRLRPS